MLLLVMLLLAPMMASGDVGDFFPTIYYTEGDLELGVMHESDANTAGGRGTRISDSLASERLLLSLDGYVYHPRFILFLIKDVPGLFEERYDNSFGGSFSQTAGTNDYEFRTKILPEHPYNLELYATSRTPYIRQATAETRVTDIQKGAIFDYADRPLFFNLSYITGETKARISTSEYRSEKASGSYLIGPVSDSALYSHTDTSTSLGMHTSVDSAALENIISKYDMSINSRVSEDLSKQESSLFAAKLDTKSTLWLEQFNADLPWHFSTSGYHNYLRNEITTGTTPSVPQEETITKTTTDNFTLAHKLYDSVRTNYSWNRTLIETPTGDTKSLTNSLNGIYTKKVPDGRLTISVQGSDTRTDQENAPLIVGETHAAPLFGTFTLARGGGDPSTISLRVLSDTGAFIDMPPPNPCPPPNTGNFCGGSYVVQASGNTVQITIESLPPLISAEGHTISYPYTFQVTYTLLASTVELETTIIGYSLNLSLFDNLITPYYSRQHYAQRLLAGSIPGGPQTTDSTLVGITIQKAPYALVTEQRVVDSDLSPSRSLRNAVEYAKRMSDTLNLSAKAEHIKTTYGQGLLGTKGYVEQVSNVNLLIIQNVPRQKLTASLAASFTQRHAIINTDLYAITGNFTWKIGNLSIDAGATLNRAESTGAGEKQTMMSEFYYVTLTRRLF